MVDRGFRVVARHPEPGHAGARGPAQVVPAPVRDPGLRSSRAFSLEKPRRPPPGTAPSSRRCCRHRSSSGHTASTRPARAGTRGPCGGPVLGSGAGDPQRLSARSTSPAAMSATSISRAAVRMSSRTKARGFGVQPFAARQIARSSRPSARARAARRRREQTAPFRGAGALRSSPEPRHSSGRPRLYGRGMPRRRPRSSPGRRAFFYR